MKLNEEIYNKRMAICLKCRNSKFDDICFKMYKSSFCDLPSNNCKYKLEHIVLFEDIVKE